MKKGAMRGMGRVYRRPDGQVWWISYYVDGVEQCESAKTTVYGRPSRYSKIATRSGARGRSSLRQTAASRWPTSSTTSCGTTRCAAFPRSAHSGRTAEPSSTSTRGPGSQARRGSARSRRAR